MRGLLQADLLELLLKLAELLPLLSHELLHIPDYLPLLLHDLQQNGGKFVIADALNRYPTAVLSFPTVL